MRRQAGAERLSVPIARRSGRRQRVWQRASHSYIETVRVHAPMQWPESAAAALMTTNPMLGWW